MSSPGNVNPLSLLLPVFETDLLIFLVSEYLDVPDWDSFSRVNLQIRSVCTTPQSYKCLVHRFFDETDAHDKLVLEDAILSPSSQASPLLFCRFLSKSLAYVHTDVASRHIYSNWKGWGPYKDWVFRCQVLSITLDPSIDHGCRILVGFDMNADGNYRIQDPSASTLRIPGVGSLSSRSSQNELPVLDWMHHIQGTLVYEIDDLARANGSIQFRFGMSGYEMVEVLRFRDELRSEDAMTRLRWRRFLEKMEWERLEEEEEDERD